jgi:hypothetical protein
MNEWIWEGWPLNLSFHRNNFLILLCALISFTPTVVPCFIRSTVSYKAESLNCRLVSWNVCPTDEILIQLGPHRHVGCVRLFLYRYGAFHKWGRLLFPVLTGSPLCESVLLNRPVTCLAWIPLSFKNSTVHFAKSLGRKLFAWLCPGVDC